MADYEQKYNDDESFQYIEPLIVPPEELIALYQEIRSVGSDALNTMIQDNFNDLGQNVKRDKSCRVIDNMDLVEKVNKYDYANPWWMNALGGICACMCFPCVMSNNRSLHTTPPGFFAHYKHNEKHMFHPAGRYWYTDVTEEWLEDVQIDDEQRVKRDFGSKCIINVGQNALAGGYKLYDKKPLAPEMLVNPRNVKNDKTNENGEYVIFTTGRHVLPQEQYRNIQVVQLQSVAGAGADAGDIIRLGPLSIMYIKEGFLGGAFVRNEGKYQIFYPGPPYILHEQNYEAVTCVKRMLEPFKLGPYTFVNVKDGEIGGTFNKNNGTYQILPPGNTYKLHEKDYAVPTIVKRSSGFSLGPYNYIAANMACITGAYNRTKGDFIIFKPGHTYRINTRDFDNPETQPRNSNIIKVGPFSFLTVQKNRIAGAYRVVDGVFEEFEEGREYKLHQKDYYGIVDIKKYESHVQEFGPNIVITISDGFDCVFEKEGKLEVAGPGYYKRSSEYKVRDQIPHQAKTSIEKEKMFKTKDGIEMSLNVTLVWQVVDPIMVAKYTDRYKGVEKDLLDRTETNLRRICATHGRAELLPTQQDIIVQHEGEVLNQDAIDRLMIESKNKMLALYTDIQSVCGDLIRAACMVSHWGVEILSLQIDNMVLHDQKIIENLSMMTQSLLATKVQDAGRKALVNQAEADRLVAITKSSTQSDILKQQAQNKSDIEVLEAQGKARSEAEKYRIKKEMEKQMAETDADIRKINMEIAYQEQKRKADAVIVEAEAMARQIELKNAAEATMPGQQFELELARIRSDAMKNYGNAAWKYPDQMTAFMNQFSDKMNLSLKPLPLSEALQIAKQ